MTLAAEAAEPAPAAASFDAWADAVLALLLFSIDLRGTGVALRAGAGPVRDRWLALLRAQLGAQPIRRLPLHIRDERLLGGLDLTATLQAGRPVALRGLLADSDGGVLLVAMAERLEPGTAARLAAVIDRGEVVAERDGVGLVHAARFGVVALDEGEDGGPEGAGSGRQGEHPPACLHDRLAFRLDLVNVQQRDALAGDDSMLLGAGELAEARRRCALVQVPEDLLQAVCTAALALGVGSLRASLQALCVVRAHAALQGRDVAEPEDAAVAARLVLAPRATALPQAPEQPPPEEPADSPDEDETPPPEPPTEPPPEPPPDPPEDTEDTEDTEDSDATPPPGALQDLILQAALAALPPDLLAQLKAGQASREAARAAGVAGALQKTGRRGRPVGVRRGEPRGGQRLNVIETLRAAVPWQKLRQRTAAGAAEPAPGHRRVEVRAEDFHVTQIRQRRETTTIFAVDASGSSALQRLAEAKGAVELLLADCYVRRDKVAVLGFRGRSAELLLPPTRSLVRAKRALSGLPGGGGTPLAAALDAANGLADAARRRGDTPVVVLLTDGRANVALDGTGGRARAEADALDAARRLRVAGGAVLLIDTSALPSAQAAKLAQAMQATYLPLPQAGAQAVSRVVRAAS
jgi:magnesium chelatase subunit D